MKSSGEYSRVKKVQSSISAHNYFMSNPSLSGRGKSIKIKKPKNLYLKINKNLQYYNYQYYNCN